MARPLQLEGGKLPPVPRAGFAAGDVGGKGARAARYVHRDRNISQVQGWRGNSAEGREIQRRDRRDKLTQQVVNSLNRCGREKQAKALATCGEWFDVWARPDGKCKLLPCPCDSMFCPDCANRRARPLIKKLKAMVNRPGRSYWFLTLTVPNVENLSRYDISDISEQFAELCRSWVFREFEDEKGITRKIYGGVRSIECVYEPETKSWHPHIHVLFEAPKRLPPWWLVLLKAAWNRITGDARYLHLQRAYTVTRRGKQKFNHLNEKALREVCKYVTKCAEFAGDHLLVDEFLKAFGGVRRLQCFGSFHGAGVCEFEREPGDEIGVKIEEEYRLSDDGYRRLPFRAHVGDTEVLPDGTRQLTFEFMERVRVCVESESPPWELTPVPEVSSEQRRIEFSGAMPEKSERQPWLFEGAA
jgi:plasmid rolling circle replication initiator protein Rep